MKKPTKSASSPAPATPPPAPLPKLAAKPPSKARAKPAAAVAPAPAPTPAPAVVPVARVAPVLAAPRPAAPSLTVIHANVDVGFGNALYIRGEGPGLSWNKGLALTNVSSGQWTISLPRSSQPLVFKFLLNDETWSVGADYQADPGSDVTLSPTF